MSCVRNFSYIMSHINFLEVLDPRRLHLGHLFSPRDVHHRLTLTQVLSSVDPL